MFRERAAVESGAVLDVLERLRRPAKPSEFRPHTNPVYAVSTPAGLNPYRSTAASRSLYFWILPEAVIGYSSTKSTYSGTLK